MKLQGSRGSGPLAISLPWLQQQLPFQSNTEILLEMAKGAPLNALAMAENN